MPERGNITTEAKRRGGTDALSPGPKSRVRSPAVRLSTCDCFHQLHPDESTQKTLLRHPVVLEFVNSKLPSKSWRTYVWRILFFTPP